MGVPTTANSFMVQHHALIAAELYFFHRSTACQNCGLRNRYEHFSQQGGTAHTHCFIDLEKKHHDRHSEKFTLVVMRSGKQTVGYLDKRFYYDLA